MGRGKIERETKREKGFSLGRNARGRSVQGTTAFEKTQREYVQEQRKRKPHKKEKEEKAANREPLKEKEDNQERAMRGEENKKERVKCCRL